MYPSLLSVDALEGAGVLEVLPAGLSALGLATAMAAVVRTAMSNYVSAKPRVSAAVRREAASLSPRAPLRGVPPTAAAGASGAPASPSDAPALPVVPPQLWRHCAAGHFRAPIDLPADLVQAARAKLGETPRRKFEALAALRKRCEAATRKQTSGFARMDDQFLLAFLRAKRFDVDKAWQCLLKYTELVAEVGAEDCVVRRDAGLNQEEMGRLYAMDLLQLLPGAARDGSRIGLVRGRLFDDTLLSALAAPPDAAADDGGGGGGGGTAGSAGDRPLRFLLWLFTRLVSDPYVQVNGLTLVEDLGGMELMSGVRFARSLDRGPKRRLLRLVQSALPIRFVAFYMVDAPPQLGAVLALARPFLAKKMRQRIIMASGLLADDPQAAAEATNRGAGVSGPQPSPRQTEMDAVARLLGPRSLPAEFGGTLDSGALSLSWWEEEEQQQQQQQQQQQGGGRPIIAAATELGMLIVAA